VTTPAVGSGGEVRERTGREISLVDLLDRLLGTGVVLAGDITISLSGVDLVEVKLHAIITSVRVESDET